MKLLACAIAILVAGSGCIGGSAETEAPGDNNRRSVGGSVENGTQFDTVYFFESQISMVGQDSQSFEVRVPANITNVDFHLSWTDAAQLFGLRVELSGCGAYDQGMGSYTSGGGSAMDDRVCAKATEGDQTLTVSNTGYVDATLTLRGKTPKANETVQP